MEKCKNEREQRCRIEEEGIGLVDQSSCYQLT